MRLVIVLFLLFSLARPLTAGEADVVAVEVRGNGPDYSFSVTVKHGDTGWDHYADRWEVVGSDGTVYGTRILAHPHVDEQPFTRQGRATVPDGVSSVTVRARDSVHGYGGREMIVDLPGR